MNTQQVRMINLPIKGDLLWIYICSLLIATLMAGVSIVGLRYRTLIYPTDELIWAFVPNDVTNLFVGLPLLLGSMWLTWRGKLIGLLCWMGALFFVSYNYIAYVFAMPLNWAFLLHLILAMLSVYTLLGLIANMDGKVVQQRVRGAVPEKFAGGVLAGLGLLFFVRVIGIVVNTIISGDLLGRTELAVSISDFLTTPAWIIVGVLLWRRKEFGYVAGLGMLFQGSMLFVALIIFLLLQPLLASAPLAISDVVVVFVMGLICFIPFALFVHGVVAKSSASVEQVQK
jgi:hypothetical protein